MYEDLKQLHSGTLRFYSSVEFDFILQGDAYSGAPVVLFDVAGPRLRPTTVMVLSNTCDLASENARKAPVNVTVAPVVRLSRWRDRLIALGAKPESVESTVVDLRRHKVSNAFLIPAGQGMAEESVVMFDQMQSMPLSLFNGQSPSRLVTLSDRAFWLLTVKLSIHFCRLQEKVGRRAA